jgi:hypothetical protein
LFVHFVGLKRDLLLERRTYFDSNKVHEIFNRGKNFDLLEHIYDGVIREMKFNVNTRLDGLVKRIIIEGKKIIEFFEGREDRLYFRSGNYDPNFRVLSRSFFFTFSASLDC